MLPSSSALPSSSFRDAISQSVLQQSFVKSASVVNSVTASTWHSRLGHPSAATQKLVMQLCKIPLMNKNELDFCCSCCLGKAHSLHSPLSSTSYSQPLKLIFSDLWGPASFVSSPGYSYYYVTFVDAFTSVKVLYCVDSCM